MKYFLACQSFFKLRSITSKDSSPPLLIPLLMGSQIFQAFVTSVHLAQAAHRIHLLCWKFVLTVSRGWTLQSSGRHSYHIFGSCGFKTWWNVLFWLRFFMVLPMVCLSTSSQSHQLQITLSNQISWKKTVFYRWRIS